MVEISLKFNSVDEAIVALAKLTVGKKAAAATEPVVPVAAPAGAKPRKGRADKGQPRGRRAATPQSPAAGSGAPATTPPSDPAVTASEPAAPVGLLQSLSTATTPPAAPTPTIEEAQVKLEAVFNQKGLPTALEVLSRFGVKRLKDIKPEDRADFMARADGALAGQPA